MLDLGNDENYSSGISQFVSHQFEGATYEKVILPKTLTTLPTYLFSNSHVKEVVLPEALTEIPNYMFDGSDLETVVIPASVTNIGTNAFAHTPNLTSVTFAEPAAGEDPLPLTITAGGNTASTSTGAFYGSGLARLTLPDRLTAIPTSTFAYMTGLEELVIPKTITTIPNYCFIGSKISGLFLNGAINGIGNYAYSSTTGLKDITAEDLKGVVAIGTDAFESSSVETAVIPGTVVGSSLPPSTSNPTTLLYLFRYCENLTSVEFEDTAEGTERSVTLNQIFRDNPLLETVKIGEGIISFSTNVIANCPNLTTLTLPETLTNISNGTLDGCPNVKKIVLGTQLTTVGPLAFYMWDETRTICFRSSAYYIGSLIGFDWMFNTKATVIFDYEGD